MDPDQEPTEIELTILLPCLDEAETLTSCLREAYGFLARSGVRGEILVADNGSTDDSRAIAVREGASLVDVPQRGYGAALLGGIAAARGRFVVMGDADCSYDFDALEPFLDRLRAGADLVLGNRFRGGIAPGAMPPLHRYLGNPVLSFLGRLFFGVRVGDFHCGLRGFRRDRLRALRLQTTGMEFASEMIVRAALAGHRIDEVPTKLRRDGRSRPPHLRPWRDGWRHLRFLLLFSPRWLFVYPGLALLLVGLLGALVLLPGPVDLGGVEIDIHTFVVACAAALLGQQFLSFGLVARRLAVQRGLLPPAAITGRFDWLTLERLLLVALALALAGFFGLVWCAAAWGATGFGPLHYPLLLRVLVLSTTALASGFQLAGTAFFGGIAEIPARD